MNPHFDTQTTANHLFFFFFFWAYPVPQPKFQHVIDTRPELTVDPLDAEEAGGPCDVCTMGRARHASSLLTLFVRPSVSP